MSEYQGNYGLAEPPSYPFTGSAPKMDPDDFFSLKPIPDGMKPIVDPETIMCIGYEGMGSIGYDPTFGFFKYSIIYDINEKEVDQYKQKLTAKDVDAMSPEEAEEYHKFRRAVFDAEDHGMFGSSDEVWLMVATDEALENLPHMVRYTRAMGKRNLSFAERKYAEKAPETYQRARRILKERRRRIAVARLEGRPSKEPTKIEISTAIITAPTTFILKSIFKMGLSAKKLKFEEKALERMKDLDRYIPKVVLEHIIRNGIRLPDASNRAFGLMYKTYVGIVYKNGKARLVEIIVNERTWRIKHFHYVDTPRIGKLNPKTGEWSGSMKRWIDEYDKNTIFKKPFIKNTQQFMENVKATRKIKYDSKGNNKWRWQDEKN